MVSTTKCTGILFVIQAVLTATTLANTTVAETGIRHGSNITISKSRKRQEIIFLRDDFTNKRNKEGETIANLEKHGKSLSAEGNVFKGRDPKADDYEDSLAYKGPALKEQSVKINNGPPEIQENEKKSDAYEIVQGENDAESVVKVGHPLVTAHASDKPSHHIKGHHRSGLHIVSLDQNDDGVDSSEDSLREKDLRLYGSIGSPYVSPVRHHPHRSRVRPHHRFYQNDYIPPNVVSLSQDDFNGPLSQSDGHAREEIFPSFRRRNPFFFSQPSQLPPPEELMQRFQPVSPKAMSYGNQPNMIMLPMYNGRADANPALVPMTTQSAFPASPPQFGAAPFEYTSPGAPPTGMFRNELLLEPALQVPQIPAQPVNPPYMMQSDGQILFNNQQPDLRSLYQLQTQPQFQIPQAPMPQLTQPQQTNIPTEMQMTPELLSSAGQREISPANRWVDEDGRQRSEVLNRDRQDEERPQDERNEDDDDDEARHQSSRYDDSYDEDSRADEGDDDRAREEPPEDRPEQSYSRDEEEGPSEEEGEDMDEPEEDSQEDANGRSYEDEQSPEPRPPDEGEDEDQGMAPQQESFNPQPMARFIAPSRPFNIPNIPLPQTTAPPPQMEAQEFSRYQLMSPTSALKEHILPTPSEEPKPPPTKPNSNLQISQMSTAEAQYLENTASMEPNFKPSVYSKDTIPGKSRRFRVGLGNVLIRLNGKPLEDSSQLRSKIINGQIIQGQGKLIKSKGPVRVKLSHTKDAKHLKIIDILAPKQFQVYDTKSNIRRPATNVFNSANKTNANLNRFDSRKRA